MTRSPRSRGGSSTTVDVIREMNDLPTGPLTVGTDLHVPSSVHFPAAEVVLAAARVDGNETDRPPSRTCT